MVIFIYHSSQKVREKNIRKKQRGKVRAETEKNSNKKLIYLYRELPHLHMERSERKQNKETAR